MENKRNAEQGTYNGEITYCPVNGWDCPYYKKACAILMIRLKIAMISVHFLKVGKIGRNCKPPTLLLICSTNKNIVDKAKLSCYNITILRTNGGMNDEGCYQ